MVSHETQNTDMDNTIPYIKMQKNEIQSVWLFIESIVVKFLSPICDIELHIDFDIFICQAIGIYSTFADNFCAVWMKYKLRDLCHSDCVSC